MSDGIHPDGPSQPSLAQGYDAPGNPATKEPLEQAHASQIAHDDSNKVASRVPNKQTTSISEATPSSLGRGIHGAPPGEEAHGRTQASLDSEELDAAQMGAPGEGKINAAVQNKAGASGAQPGLEEDLARKKAEQAPARQQVQEEQQKDVDVGGVLGQRGGPANPVDKDGYPNAGS